MGKKKSQSKRPSPSAAAIHSSKKAVKSRPDSVSREISRVNVKARHAAERAKRLTEEAVQLERSSDVVHHGIEGLHVSLEQAHEEVHELAAKGHRALRSAQTALSARLPFPVVGIGASAGGFEALCDLLRALRPDTGMAFVFVQHLDPSHESKLASLLASSTRMEVVQIQDGTAPAPNRLFVIPPNHSLLLRDGVLRLYPRKKAGENFPIDQFLQSLAQEQGNHALGIILSGNGQDGTIGLKEIKAAGGITFAQEVRSAKFAGMPQSANRAGCVDFNLPPGEIARELDRIADHWRRQTQEALSGKVPLLGTEEQLARIFGLLRNATGVDFSSYKLTTLQRRIMRRIVLKKIDNLGNYLRHLQQDPAEVEALFHDILINVTGFFRDPGAFQALRKRIFPRIVKQKPIGSPVRIWVPGCATGEEVYSLAICLHEFLGKNLTNKIIQIFGTDISDNMVTRARLGVYPKNIESQVSPERLRRYFQKHDGGYQISKFIRDICIFARQNVAEDPPFSKLDLISCRNLLIYLGMNLQKKVFPIFHYSLRPGGYLMLGTSETIGTFSDLFTIVDKRNKIYSRNETYSRAEMEFLPASHLPAEERQGMRMKPEASSFDLQKRADEVLLSQLSPASVIVNSRLDVLHFRGKTGPYLEPTPGTASLNLLKMVRSELTAELRTALAQAGKVGSTIRKEGIALKDGEREREVSVEVIPFKHAPVTERFFLVLFRDISPALQSGKPGGQKLLSRRTEKESARLREELAETKESLQTIIEEQEASNEELKSANEEIQSSNEELQAPTRSSKPPKRNCSPQTKS